MILRNGNWMVDAVDDNALQADVIRVGAIGAKPVFGIALKEFLLDVRLLDQVFLARHRGAHTTHR